MDKSEKLYVVGLAVGLTTFSVNNIYCKILGSILLFAILLYPLTRVRNLKKEIEMKDKAMGIRVLEGMRILADSIKKAWDQIKIHNSKIEKSNAKIGEVVGQLHRFNQSQHRLVRERSPQEQSPENYSESKRIAGEIITNKSLIERSKVEHDRISQDVRDTEHKP